MGGKQVSGFMLQITSLLGEEGDEAKSLSKCPHLQKGSVVVRISGQEDPWRPWGTSESWDRGTPGASLPVGLHPQFPLLLA